MAHHLFLTSIDAQGTTRQLPLDAELDAGALSQETVWLDVVALDDQGHDHDQLIAVLHRIGVPGWLDTNRLLKASEAGTGRRPSKIRVVDGAFLSRFYWVSPETITLDAFMDEVLRDATGRGEFRPRRQEVRAFCGEGLLITSRSLPDEDDPAQAHEQLAELMSGAPIAAHGRVATAAAMLARFLGEVLEDELDAIEGYDSLADDLQDRVLDAPVVGNPRSGETPPLGPARSFSDVEIQKGLAVMRREVGLLRRLLIPYGELRELTQVPIPCVQPLMAEFTDLREGVLRVVEWIDTVRDLLTSTYEALLARQSNAMNQIMKKLTAWAAILLVPMLITGIYGMNFSNMPELNLVHGYYGALGLIVASMLVLYLVFRRKRWL